MTPALKAAMDIWRASRMRLHAAKIKRDAAEAEVQQAKQALSRDVAALIRAADREDGNGKN